jgi:hypothetical protein
LPDDSELFADLTAPTFMDDRRLITLEDKKKVVERLGRSPNKGDAVVMAWHYGPRFLSEGVPLPSWEYGSFMEHGMGRRFPKVVMGRRK